MRFRPHCGVALLLALSPAAAAAQRAAAIADSVFAVWRTTTGPGCTVGIDSGGARITRAYGMANLEYGVPLKPESIVESGSVAKQFTSAAVALLAIRGKLALDDDIRRYLPEVPDFGHRITVGQLLHHTSGLRDQWGLLGMKGLPPGEAVHDFNWILDLVARQQRLNFKPGDEYLYSNTGYALAAIIVERVAGVSLAEFSRTELFQPLGMTRTEWRADFRKTVPDRATAYSRGRDGWRLDMPFTNVHGNGGLLSTVGDLLIWNDALTRGTIPGGAEMVRMLETTGKLNDGSPIEYALGLGVGRFRGLRSVTHGGATAGYRTYLARWPEKALSVAVLCNAANADPGGYANQIAIRMLGLPATETPPRAAVAIATEALGRYAGRYRDSTTDQVVTFALQGDKLTASAGGPPITLTHLGEDRLWSQITGEFKFSRRGDRWVIDSYDDAHRHYEPDPAVDPASVDLAGYVGDYRSSEIETTLALALDKGSLMIRMRPAGRLPLTPIYRDGFMAPGGRTVRFVRDGGGKVVGLRIFAGRVRDLRFDRVEKLER